MICDICGRGNITLREHSFGEREFFYEWSEETKKVNPNFLKIKVCSTDLHLIYKIKNALGKVEPKKILAAAQNYRRDNPIEEPITDR